MVIKIIQFVRYSFLFIFMGLLSGCWPTLMINGKTKYYISQETAQIKLSARVIRGYHHFIEVKSQKGGIIVDPDALRLTYVPSIIDERTEGSRILYKKKQKREIFHVKEGETFVCRIYAFPNREAIELGVQLNEIQILPGDFITHSGKPLITDTIRIKVVD